jgi:carboxymethylenebutenolidase
LCGEPSNISNETAQKSALRVFAWGGAVAIIGAARVPELTAAVAFYGIPPEQAVKPADVKIPLQGHFANKDDWCTPKVVDDFEKGLVAAGKNAEFFRYDADHAFVNEQRMSAHDREAAEQAWGRATDFFKKRLE